jgi:hypothetical protein
LNALSVEIPLQLADCAGPFSWLISSALSTKQKTGPKATPRSRFRRPRAGDRFHPAAVSRGAIASATQ